MDGRFTASLLALVLPFALASCGDSPSEKENAQPESSAESPEDEAPSPGASLLQLEVSPARPRLAVGDVSSVTARARYSDGFSRDVSREVTWSVTPEGLLDLRLEDTAHAARIEARAAGAVRISARLGQTESAPVELGIEPLELKPAETRALWVTRFAFKSESDVRRIIRKAAEAGFNVVYFQIRGQGDAYYSSRLVPWAKELTGTLGKNPGWDPLAVAIDEAHRRGLQLHAYWNVFSAWPVPKGCGVSTTGCLCAPNAGPGEGAPACVLPEASPPGQPTHFLRAHPETMALTRGGTNIDSEYYWFSPGSPLVRQHLLAVAEELLQKYPVDGLHLDRVRYPGPEYSYDAASTAAYAKLPSLRPTYADWQRQNVTDVVAALYAQVKRHRPLAAFSAAVWGIYEPLPNCKTSSGRNSFFQDSYAWTRLGIIDALAPMIYWDLGSGCTDFGKLLDGFIAQAHGRHIIAGMHAWDDDRPQMSRISARIDYARSVGAAGVAIFASNLLDAKAGNAPSWPEQWPAFRSTQGRFGEDARPAPMPWR